MAPRESSKRQHGGGISVRSSLAWSYGANALAFVVTFAASIAVARLLTPHELGIFAVGTATAGVLAIISSFAVGPYLVRAKEPDADERSAAFTLNGLLNLVLAIAMSAIATIETEIFSAPALGRVLAILAWTPILSTFEFLPATLMMRASRFAAISQITFGRALVNAAAVILLAWQGWSYLSPALAALAAGGFSLIAYNVAGRRHVSVRLSLSGWPEMLKFGLQMMSVGGIATLSARLSEIVLARTLGVSALGVYTRASGLATMVWDNVYGLATRVIFVEMADEQRKDGTLHRSFLLATQLLTAVLWPLVIGIAILAQPLVHLLYGAKWQGAALPLSILMIAQFVAMSFALNWELCVLTNRTGWQARAEAARAGVGLAAFSVGALLSLAGAALGRLAEALVGYFIYRPKMDEMAGSASGEVAAIYRGSAILTLAAVAPAGALMVAMRWSPTTPPVAIAASVLVGGVFWLLTLVALGHPLFSEIRLLVNRAVRADVGPSAS